MRWEICADAANREMEAMTEDGYINYYAALGLQEGANAGEVRRTFKRTMKKLVSEIAQVEITEERRAHYLLEMAKLNAALFVLRDKERREQYETARRDLIALEQRWNEAADDPEASDALRRQFDGDCREFLSKYVEETMLKAGRDKECVEASHWDPAHERHAFRILRHYRHSLYHDILERLPYSEITPPQIDWEERAEVVKAIIAEEGVA